MRVVVITPTVGTDWLPKAMQSVGLDAEHWIVVDGVQHYEKVVQHIQANRYNQRIIVMPENTGGVLPKINGMPYTGKYNGYRINAAIPLVTNADYVLFLDEDNWYEPNHIKTMIDEVEKNDLDWAYSLRKVVDKEGKFLFNDDCDSLGDYPSINNGLRFVDMNCYIFKNRVLAQVAHRLYDIMNPFIGDKMLFQELVSRFQCYGDTGLYTVNYRCTRDGQDEWFEKGNKFMSDKHKGVFPWKK
jgi:glycosyltransferase involved in cell wall biosynthesis